MAKCLKIENEEYGISFHLFHPPLTNTKSASGITISQELKADARKVGYGLADHIWSKKFLICHSVSQTAQIKISYHFPLSIGEMMSKAAKRAAKLKEVSSQQNLLSSLSIVFILMPFYN